MSKKTKKNKKIISASIIFLVICIGTIFALKCITENYVTTENETPKSTENSTDISTTFSTEPVENSESTEKDNIEKKPEIIQNDGEDPNQKEELSGSLTSTYVSGGKLTIRVNIDQFLTSGTCLLSLKSSSNTVSREVNIIPSASTSTCEGFDIPIDELSNGKWNIEINLNSTEKTGIITGEVNI